MLAAQTQSGSAPSPRRRRWLWAGLLLLLALAALLTKDLLEAPAPPNYEIVFRPTALDDRAAPAAGESPCGVAPRRWIVVGWDGVGWDWLLPLVDSGQMPNFARLLADGASGNLYGIRPSLSPVLWTSVATGVRPSQHGVLGFEKRKPPLLRRLERIRRWGRLRRELFSNADRRSPAIWNLFSDAGRSVLAVGYHNSYPAEPIDGLMVSNYLMQAQMAGLLSANAQSPDRFVSSLVHPADQTERVLGIEHEVRRQLAEALPRFADLPSDQLRRLAVAPLRPGTTAFEAAEDQDEQRRLFFLRQAWLLDSFHAELATRYFEELQPELTLLHFQAVDLASHHFLYFHQPTAFDTSNWTSEQRARLKTHRAKYQRTVGEYFRFLDDWLGRLLALRDERTGLLILSDHGFDPSTTADGGGFHDDAPPGILLMHGPGIRAGARIEQASLLDILPTLLAAAELPAPANLEGRVLDEPFCSDAGPVRETPAVDASIDTVFIPRVAPPPQFEREIVEQLRSLGYLR